MFRKGIHPVVLLCLYVLVALLPLGLAALQGLPPRPFQDELASAIAMVGFSMLLVEFVLSGRFRWVSGRIGIDVTMRFHQLIARGLAVFSWCTRFSTRCRFPDRAPGTPPGS